MEVISIVNRKGGIGKTTSAVNISNELAFLGYKVLMLDLDSQCDLTKIYGKDDELGIYDVLKEEVKIEEAVVKTDISDNLYLVPGSEDIIHWREEDQEDRLKEALNELSLKDESDNEIELDFVIVDHPPNLNESALTGFVASDEILIVLEPEAFCVNNINSLLNDVTQIKELMNSDLSILGMLINRVDKRRSLTNRVIKKIRNTFGDDVLGTTISNNTAIPTSIYDGIPIRELAETKNWYSKTLSEFRKVIIEIIERLGVNYGDE